MILAVDIGNTSISFALIKREKIIKSYTIVSFKGALKSRVVRILRSANKKAGSIDDVVMCSVVPKHSKLIEMSVRQIFKKPPLIVGRNIKVPMVNKYKIKRQVGQDRLVTAYAARKIYKAPVIVVDFGTAVTFDVVNRRGEYEGGVIVPGVRLAAESLFKKTALLPKISSFKVPKSVIGKTTQESILSGLYYGKGALVNGLIKDIKKKVKGARVIATGGHADEMSRFIKRSISVTDKNLVFKGIKLLYDTHKCNS